ncbi:MAG TPA: carboxypeptidase-like regulatory domain-containing protein [Tepidisphaeraceae bacterium]|nr:carboxypeptidase-like regulatory domain-containing protein [Tepidisphaeraceae bacterium]
MFSFLRKCIIPAVVAAGMLGFSTIPFARAEDKPAAGDQVKKGSISGTVLDKDGKPVSGAMIGVIKPQGRQGGGNGARPNRGGNNGANNGAVKQATEDPKPAPPEPGRGNRQRPEPLFKATTDADGKFTIKDVPAGEYAVMARVEGKGMARERVTVKADETATVSLKLQDRPARGGGAGAGGNRPNRGGNAQ